MVRRAFSALATVCAAVATAQAAGAAGVPTPVGTGVAQFHIYYWAQSSLYGMKLTGAFPLSNGSFVGSLAQTSDAVLCNNSGSCPGTGMHVPSFGLAGESTDGTHHLTATCSGTGDDATQLGLVVDLRLTCDAVLDGTPAGTSTLVIAGANTGAPDAAPTGSDIAMTGTFTGT